MRTGVIEGAPNFTYEELCRSAVAERRGLDNSPDEAVCRRIAYLARNVLQPVRDRFEQPVVVTSGYRSPAVNRAVGGSSTSHHMTGAAADIRVTGVKLKSVFSYIAKQLPFTELIAENLGGSAWVHVALVEGRGAEKAIKYMRVGGGVHRSDFETVMGMEW